VPRLRSLTESRAASLLWNYLIVVSVHHEPGYVDALQILTEVGFGERLDAVVMSLGPV
jgi:hypothetical protein